MNTLPIFYSKPLIIIVDDDIRVTNALYELLNKFYTVLKFNDPNNLLNYVINYKSFFDNNKFLRSFTESEYADIPNKSLVEFDISKLLDSIDHTDLQKEIGVVLIDYLMPDLDGISLCKKIIDYPFKKILFTGSEEYKMGIMAIRDGLIDSYIDKTETADNLLNKILDSSFNYYNQNTFSLKQNIEAENILPLSDKLFVNYFMKLFNEYDVVQFCLYDKNGSIFMIHSNGEKSILLVHTDRSLKQFLSFIEEDFEFQDIYKLIVAKQKIPFIDSKYNIENLDLDTVKLYIPDLLVGKETYYLQHLLTNTE
jgi:FixJ family two-component response regulator